MRYRKIVDCEVGWNTVIGDFVDLYRCKIGNYCKIHSFVYIEEGVKIGNSCIIKPHCFLPTGVVIEDEVFIGPGVMFVNDRYPRSFNNNDWKLEKTIVRRCASIGAGAVIMCGVEIGKFAIVGAGAVVVDDVEAKATVVGNPAKPIKRYFNGLWYKQSKQGRWYTTSGTLNRAVWNFHYPNDKVVTGDGYVIHHVNRDPSDDRIENLEKLTQREHLKIHRGKWNEEMIMFANLLRERGYTLKIIALRIKDKFNVEISDASISTHIKCKRN